MCWGKRDQLMLVTAPFDEAHARLTLGIATHSTSGQREARREVELQGGWRRNLVDPSGGARRAVDAQCAATPRGELRSPHGCRWTGARCSVARAQAC